jgi:hypothetical protein
MTAPEGNFDAHELYGQERSNFFTCKWIFSTPSRPRMLRHAVDFKLAKDGHDTRASPHYFGDKNSRHMVRREIASEFRQWRNP